jgi:hypothetical protein
MLTIAFKFILATSLASGVVFGAMAQASAHGNASGLTTKVLITSGALAAGSKIKGVQETGTTSSRFSLYGTEMPAAEQAAK